MTEKLSTLLGKKERPSLEEFKSMPELSSEEEFPTPHISQVIEVPLVEVTSTTPQNNTCALTTLVH